MASPPSYPPVSCWEIYSVNTKASGMQQGGDCDGITELPAPRFWSRATEQMAEPVESWEEIKGVWTVVIDWGREGKMHAAPCRERDFFKAYWLQSGMRVREIYIQIRQNMRSLKRRGRANCQRCTAEVAERKYEIFIHSNIQYSFFYQKQIKKCNHRTARCFRWRHPARGSGERYVGSVWLIWLQAYIFFWGSWVGGAAH